MLRHDMDTPKKSQLSKTDLSFESESENQIPCLPPGDSYTSGPDSVTWEIGSSNDDWSGESSWDNDCSWDNDSWTADYD